MSELCNLSEVQVKKQRNERGRAREWSSKMVGRKSRPPGAARVQGPEVLLVNTLTVNGH